jgi:uncharacterized protein YukE
MGSLCVSNFYVNAEYVGKFGDQVSRASDDAHDGKDYVERRGEISVSEQGWLAQLGDAHKMIQQAIAKELDGLAEACSGGSRSLRQAAAYYGHTDADAAGTFDTTLHNYADRDDYITRHYDHDGGWVN